MDEPYWVEDFLAAGHQLNSDGTVDLYHGTTRETARKMVQTQKMLTAPGAPAAYGVYLSTSPDISEKGGYGDGSVVRVRCRVKDLELDDQFPDGRMDFSVQQKTYRPVRIFHHGMAEGHMKGFALWLEDVESLITKMAGYLDQLEQAYQLIAHQTYDDSAASIMKSGFGKNGLHGTSLFVRAKDILNTASTMFGKGNAAIHKGSNSLVIMAVPKKILIDYKIRSLITFDDHLVDLNSQGKIPIIGLPTEYIVGYFAKDTFFANGKFSPSVKTLSL